LGQDFLINQKYNSFIMNFSPKTDRICSLRIRGVFCNTTEEQKDDFYEDLERIYRKVPRHDKKIVMGDFNAKAGREPCLAPNVGKHSLHEETSNNGWRMIDFAITKKMAISSTVFQNKRIHKET
jgi:hypothetical protein